MITLHAMKRALFVLVLGGCAGGAGQTNPIATGDAGADGGPSSFGLTVRPSNTTCNKPATPDGMPEKLSATGCVDPKNPTQPAAGLIPYDVVTPLWSDGAAKGRYFALPEGTKIHVKDCAREPDTCKPVEMGGTPTDEGDWDFPVGTVLMKTFGFGDKLIETRLLIRFNQYNWLGFSYEWDAAQTDATLLADNVEGYIKSVPAGAGATQMWHFPSRAHCLQCHTDAAGVALGPETKNLNSDFTYPSGRKSNQVATLDHIGVLDATPAMLPAYVNPADTAAPLEARARSYMQENCAICHRAKGNFESIDLRFSTPLAGTRLCNVAPEKGTAGVPGALRLVPGDPSKSLVSIRMHLLDQNRMPHIGSRVIDPLGTSLVDQWITSITACP
jgi:uncharacterized repeat protein (TIGR03806 family)